MSHIRIDKQKAYKKWAPVLENMGVEGTDKLDWLSEYAEYHSINENAYLNSGIAGMGSVLAPQPSSLAGNTLGSSWNTPNSNLGSGDLGQNLLPVAMKIAAQTIGLDLVAVKPTPGPKIDLMYIDFAYDDNDGTIERPQVFTLNAVNIAAIKTAIRANLVSNSIVETVGGIKGGRIWYNMNSGAVVTS